MREKIYIDQDILQNGGVALAYLFGSQAKGHGDKRSDVDVAVLFDGELGPVEVFNRTQELYLRLRKGLSSDLDLVPLNYATDSLKYEVVSSGSLIYTLTLAVKTNFEFATIREYLDDLHRHDIFVRALRERVEKGVFDLIDRRVVEERLTEMNENLKILSEMQGIDREKFKADPKIYKLAERCLHLAIECVLDVGSYIIAGKGLMKPKDYAEVIEILGERNVLPQDFANRIVGMANLRNILVHAYLKIDRDVLYEKLGMIDDFRTFQGHILQFISEPKKG